jgi:diacylglycerol kinase (ATP)
MRLALVVNSASGRHRATSIAERAAARFAAAGHAVQLLEAGTAASSHRLAADVVASGVESLVVVGGDGAVHDVLDLVAGTGTVLGLIPAGTGNDTARSLGIPTKEVDAAVDVVVAGHVRTVDLAQVGDAHVATVVASGFDSQVNERANAMTWPRGNLRYNLAILAELRAFRPLDYTLTIDGAVIEREAMLVAVGNGPSFGGGLRICEGAVMDDGLLDVVVINPVSKAKLLRVFPRLYRGTHVRLAEFERHRVREVTLSYGDGARLGPLPRTVTVRPGALRVFAPPASP